MNKETEIEDKYKALTTASTFYHQENRGAHQQLMKGD
jgi:hypothetical protein